MDIDQFLEREISGIDLEQSSPASKYEKRPEVLESELAQPSSISNLDQAEQEYNTQWQSILGHQLTWDKEAYQSLFNLASNLSGTLAMAFEDAEKKRNSIQSLITQARVFLKEGKLENASKLLGEIESSHASIPNAFFEEKRILGDGIKLFARDLKNATDSDISKRAYSLIQQSGQFVVSAEKALHANDIRSAGLNYLKSLEIFNQIPEGFIIQKSPLGARLLQLYRNVTISMEISHLQMQLTPIAVQQQKPQAQPASRISVEQSKEHGNQKPQAQPAQPKFQISSQHAQQRPRIEQRQMRLSRARIRSRAKLTKPAEKPSENPAAPINPINEKLRLLNEKKDLARENIKKGLYNEAMKNIQEALQIEPKDAEAKIITAKIKTLQ